NAQLVEEAGLADAGVPRDDEDATASRAQRIESLPPQTELARTAHEPRLHPRQASLRPSGGCDARDGKRRHGLALPFQLQLARLAPVEQTLDRTVRRVVDEDGARLGGGLQPRSDVHRVAESRVLDPRAGADLPHDHRTGRGTDAHTEAFGTPAAPHLARVLLHLTDD